jgi:hypothetical protein
MGRHHPRVARVELRAPSAAGQLRRDLVDPFGNDENRSVHCLRQEVSHRPVEAPGEEHPLPILRHEGERAVDREHLVDVRREESAARLLGVHRPEPLGAGGDQVDHSGDVL